MPTVNFILVDLAYTPHPHETTQNCSESSLASMVRYKTTDRSHLYPDFFSSFCIYLMECSSPTQQNRSTISYPLCSFSKFSQEHWLPQSGLSAYLSQPLELWGCFGVPDFIFDTCLSLFSFSWSC